MTQDSNLNLVKEEVNMIYNALSAVCQTKEIPNFEKHLGYPRTQYEALMKKMGDFYAYCQAADQLANASSSKESP